MVDSFRLNFIVPLVGGKLHIQSCFNNGKLVWLKYLHPLFPILFPPFLMEFLPNRNFYRFFQFESMKYLIPNEEIFDYTISHISYK